MIHVYPSWNPPPPSFSMCLNYAFTTYNNLACWNGLNGPYMQKSSLFVMNVSSCWVSRVPSLKIPMPDKSSLPYFPWPFPNSIQGSSMVVKEDGLGLEQQSSSTSIEFPWVKPLWMSSGSHIWIQTPSCSNYNLVGRLSCIKFNATNKEFASHFGPKKYFRYIWTWHWQLWNLKYCI